MVSNKVHETLSFCSENNFRHVPFLPFYLTLVSIFVDKVTSGAYVAPM